MYDFNCNSHLTALHRTKLSAPMRFLLNQGKLSSPMLDYGSGHGFDAKYLTKKGIDCVAYDSYWSPIRPFRLYKLITCIYVLNTLRLYERIKALNEILTIVNYDGIVYFAVRRDITFEGYRYRSHTYQFQVYLPLTVICVNKRYCIYEYRHNTENYQALKAWMETKL